MAEYTTVTGGTSAGLPLAVFRRLNVIFDGIPDHPGGRHFFAPRDFFDRFVVVERDGNCKPSAGAV
jgi:hypothetical protein